MSNVSWDLLSGGAKNGSRSVRFRSNSGPDQYLVQTVNFDLAQGSDLRVSGGMKRWNSSDSGTITVEIWNQTEVSYGPDTACTAYPSGLDENTRTSTNMFFRRTTDDFSPTANWSNLLGSTWVVPSTSPFVTMDVQIRVTTDLENSSGVNASVRLDNLRIECTSFNVSGCT